MKHEYHSELSREELLARLREKTRPWSKADMRERRGAWYCQERPDGALRLARTDEDMGVVYADITVAPAPGYRSELSVRTSLPLMPRAAFWVVAAVALLLPLGNALLFPPFSAASLCGLVVAAPGGWLLRRVGRGIPIVIGFIEKNLLRRAMAKTADVRHVARDCAALPRK